jgi:hypothetical protein
MRGVMAVARGIARAVRARPLTFVVASAGVFALHVLLPPLVLSLARKPVDFFTVNPWLPGLPSYLGAAEPPLATKLEKIANLALFWFSASNPYGTEWGFAVDVTDLARMLAASVLIAIYFALWYHRRDVARAMPRLHVRVPAGRAGFLGVSASVLGLTTGPCSVMGCGSPVIPVIGLAFAGLSSTTLAVMRTVSTWMAGLVLLLLVVMVVRLGHAAGADACRDASA